MFLAPKYLGKSPPEFLDMDYLIGVDDDHVVKFCGDRPKELGDPMADFKQESPADAVKPARRKSMQKLLQFDVFHFISPNSISPNCQCIASRGMFSQALGLYCYTQFEIRKSGVCQL